MIADICVVAILTLFIWMGYRAGLMKTFVNILSYIISIIISCFLYPVVSDFLIETPLYSKLIDILTEKIHINSLADTPAQAAFGVLSNYINSSVQSAATGAIESMAAMLINILAFVIILLLSRVIIRVVGNVLGLLTRLPLIKQLNRFGGSVLGGILGVLVLYIVSAVLILVSPINPQSKFYNEIENSTFASEIYENNIILNFLGKER